MENVKTFQNGKNAVKITFNVITPAAELPPETACRAVLGKPIWQVAEEMLLQKAQPGGMK